MKTTQLRRVMTAALLMAAATGCGSSESGSTSISANTGSPTSDSATSGSEPGETSVPTQPSAPDEAGTVAGSLDGAELGAPYLGQLTFQWPQACAVPVVEEVLKSGKTAVLHYTLDLQADGQNLLVGFDDMSVISIDGTELPDAMSKTAAASFLLPSFVVDRDGFVLDVVGMDALVEQIEALDPSGDFEVTPELAAVLEDSVTSKYWDSWAGMWATWGSFEDDVEAGTSEFAVAGGTAVSDVEMQSLGAVDGSSIALRSTITLDGDDFTIAMGGTVAMVTGSDPTSSSSISGQRVVTVEVVTDPATLRPTSAFTSIEIEVTADGDTRSQVEERHWAFDWTSCA